MRLLLILLLPVLTQAAIKTAPPSVREAISTIDSPHPLCNSPIDLNIGRDYFSPILNELPGQKEYNELVSLYQHAEWQGFEKQLEEFKKVFDTSPLLEAANFLTVQSQFERVKNSKELAEVEKNFRELLLLYPKSVLVPVVTASMAYYWLHSEKYEKSLALYENGRLQFENSPLACVFLMGTAETQYQINELPHAKAALAKVLEKCQNRRIRAAAQIRRLDIEGLEKHTHDTLAYERVLTAFQIDVPQHYPWIIHNIAEGYYSRGEYKRAKFHFIDYLKQTTTDADCKASAQKRLGDIALRTGEPIPSVVDLYYAISDISQTGRLTTYSYLHALLLGYGMASDSDKALRFSIFDKQIDDIHDPRLKAMAFIEKGVVALAAQEPSAVGYLVRFHEREKEAAGFTVQKGPTADAIRKYLTQMLSNTRGLSGDRLAELEEQLPAVKRIWNPPGIDYDALRVHSYEDLITKGKLHEAVARLKAENTKLNMSDPIRSQVTRLMWKRFLEKPTEATFFWENREVIKSLSTPNQGIIWYAIAAKTQAYAAMAEMEKSFKTNTKLLAVKSPLGPSDIDWELTRGKIFEELGQWDRAKSVYAAINDPKYRLEVLTRLFAIAKHQDDTAKILKLGPDLVEAVPVSEKGAYLGIVLDRIISKKIWSEAKKMEKNSAKWGVEYGSARMNYFFARAAFELGNFKDAAEKYEQSLQKAPDNPEANEAFFKWGKSLMKQGNIEKAKEVWGGLTKRQDKFWSPLAENELSLLDRQPASQKK